MRGVAILDLVDLIDVSTRLSWPVYVGFAVFAGWMVWILIAPDYWWRLERSLVGWQYRDGQRIELSSAGRLGARLGTVAVLVLLCVVTVISVDRTVESRVRTMWWPSEGMAYDVGDPVESPGCTVRVVVCLSSEVVFPIPITGYRPIGSDGRSDAPEPLPDDTNLLLYVESRFFPTHIVLRKADRVTVTVYGRCASGPSEGSYGESPSDCAAPEAALPDRGVVLVALDEPAGGQTLIDGDDGQPIAPAD